MKQLANITWERNMRFVAALGNHKVELDSAPEVGGEDSGVRPKGLMMVALGGCTGMDVISILRKMQVELDYFNVRVEGETNDEHPKKFNEMTVIYEFRGKNLDFAKLEKAVNLSVEKYCGVNANYKDAMKMNYKIVILD